MTRRQQTAAEEEAIRKTARRIRSIRRAAELSQEAVGLRAGFHPSYIGRIETGGINMSLGTLVLVAEALDTTVADLVDDI